MKKEDNYKYALANLKQWDNWWIVCLLKLWFVTQIICQHMKLQEENKCVRHYREKRYDIIWGALA